MSEAAAAKPKILLVDDRAANLIALSALLEEMDCEILRADSGNEALRQLLKHEFALMLLDVQMPGMDGYEVAQHSRSNPATTDIPIIFVTATTETLASQLKGYGTGAVDFLTKPINPHVLRSKVQVFLELYRSRKRISEEVKAHERTLRTLQLSNSALRHFTHAASHDLGAPLRAITGFLGALDQEVGQTLPDTARHFLDRARNASGRMRNLLDSLLVFAGLQREVTFRDVDCRMVVEQVQADLAERMARSNAVVEVGQLPLVRGDKERLYQLFLNLIGNALKFHRTGEQPKVSVYAELRHREQVFCVQDNGVGIPLQHQERIFDAFERLDPRSGVEGTGLGLAICKQIVEQHQGRIWIESEADRGARFCFTLGGDGLEPSTDADD